ncbi:HutP family protein [Veillonella montpellierensis]|uniref:HutP family protein n=1 Tax=Veillonella montpellierensis TaxID=187328 RepID=UPI000411C0B8|nr:HutP family protein [Veillonella montpellierensis]
MEQTSLTVGRAALRLALSETRMDEQILRKELETADIRSVAVDFGGQFIPSIPKIIEHAVIAAQRQGVVATNHIGEGAVIGATQEALEQLKRKATGLNVGGKIGIARCREHLSVAIYMGVGILHLNEIAVAMAHRSMPAQEETSHL